MQIANHTMDYSASILLHFKKERLNLTSIKLMLTGAQAWASVNGPLTSGMVGIPVTIEYDESWDGLTKNLMCRCSPWGSNDGEIRTILNVGETSTVAHEVMQAGMYLHLGIEGFSSDGTLVIPTTWAKCGKIEYGANTFDDPSTEPELPIWNQLQTEVEQIKRDGYTQEQIDEIQAYVQSASQAAYNAERSKDNAVAASNTALSNAAAAKNAADTAQVSAGNASASASSAANLANGALQAQRAAEAAAQRAEAAADSGINVSASAIDYDKNVKAIAHRGYSTEAPENTLPAYILAKQNGFNYAECDVSFTSDGVAVLLHDSTIDRTSDGSGSISDLTYAEVAQYDFGAWKSADYAGAKIPTFSEFIKLCRGIGMHPYIELKNNGGYSQEAVSGLVGIVKASGMGDKVTWVSYNATFLGYVKTADNSARLGYLVDTTTEDKATAAVTTIQSLQTEENEVFANLALAYLTDAKLQHFIDAEIPVEVYYISDDAAAVADKILEANSYITGFCTDVCIAGKVLYEAYMQWSGDTTEKTLTSISATYSGGSVPVGTAVSGLSGVTVTAHYSDGSTATVTGYSLSGSIVEGENTVTVTYQGKTATFVVTGTAETGGEDSGGDDPGTTETPGTLVHSWDFTQGLTDSVGGYTAELSGATQDSTGLHLTAANNFAKLCDNIAQGDIVEVDVGALNAQDWGGNHGRLICFVDWDEGYASGAGQYGIVYRNTGEWNIYKNPWGTGGVLTAVDALANKTVRIDTGTGIAYADGVMFADNDGWRADAYYLLLGASEQAYFNATILAVRVYRP